MRRVIRKAAGSMTRMKTHDQTVVGVRTLLRDTSRVRPSSSGYRPNCHTHWKSLPAPLRTSDRSGSIAVTGKPAPWPIGISSPTARR
jgi:hypothetical protein